MDRRVCASLGLLGSLMVAAGAVACGSVAAEEKIVRDFFRASRMRDDATLSTFATASFDARRDGQVQNFKVVSIGEERSHPLPIRKYAEALEQARAAQEAFSKEKLQYQKANIETIERVEKAENRNEQIPRRDAAVQTAWTKWRDDAARHSKTVSDARVRLANLKGLVELSLSQPNGPTPDVTHLDGTLLEKDVTVNATIRTPDGQTIEKPLVVTLERAVMKDEKGQELTGRWIVTHVREPQAQKTS
jgi:hypothetical protein